MLLAYEVTVLELPISSRVEVLVYISMYIIFIVMPLSNSSIFIGHSPQKVANLYVEDYDPFACLGSWSPYLRIV